VWANAEQAQAIDWVHRLGQREPVKAGRIIAAPTVDAKSVELIDSEPAPAVRVPDGSAEEIRRADVPDKALVALLTSVA